MNLSEKSILKLLREKTNRPMKMSELMMLFSVPEDQRRELRAWLKEMTADGILIKIRGGRYGLPDEMNLVSGTIQGHANGFGFLMADTPGAADIYISRQKMNEAMHLDRVMVRLESQHRFGRPEGRVIRVLERKTTSLVGTYETFDRNGWVVPSNSKFFHDIFISPQNRNGAKKNQLVCVEIIGYPSRHQPPVGKVIEILGYADDPEALVRSILRKHEVALDFSFEAMEEARQTSASIDPAERKKRKDLTGWTIFTIDGEKAKDFDDAVSIEKTDAGFRLGVHIADVGHYVEEKSALDKEAFARGTSVYFPDDVIPMLPFELSNEICSLKPHVERLAVSVLTEFDRSGEVLGYEIFNSIIKSRQRFTYTQVARLLEEGKPSEQFRPMWPALQTMRDLSQILRKRRFRNGSVDFNIPEAEIHLDKQGRQVERIVVAEHNAAHELIEEFMLATNQVVAHRLDALSVPAIHRIHEPPNADKLEAFNEFIKGFGLKLNHVHNVTPNDLQKLLKKVRGKPQERVINILLLRSMKKALYSVTDPGHFCLAFEHYTHFTSPIRRYPDLVTHRILKSFLKRKCADRERKKMRPYIAQCAEQSSLMEIKATAVEREINDLRRAQFMEDKVGKTYSGTITSVTVFGFFVELKEYFVEGLVHVSNLADDYYIYLETEHKLQGQHKHRTYQIGDAVKVRLTKVNVAARQIDFVLATTR